MHRGYIKLWRKIEDSFLMWDSQAFHLWCVLLMMANHETKEHLFNGQKLLIKRGQILTGRLSLSEKTGINDSKIYRLLETFEREQLIEQQKNNRFSIISILSYDQYQANEQRNEQPVNNQRTTSEQQVNTPKELIRINKNIVNNIDNISKSQFKPPTLQDCVNYCIKKNINVDCDDFMNFYDSKNWMVGKNKMTNWKAALSRASKWERNLNGHTTASKPQLMDGF